MADLMKPEERAAARRNLDAPRWKCTNCGHMEKGHRTSAAQGSRACPECGKRHFWTGGFPEAATPQWGPRETLRRALDTIDALEAELDDAQTLLRFCKCEWLALTESPRLQEHTDRMRLQAVEEIARHGLSLIESFEAGEGGPLTKLLAELDDVALDAIEDKAIGARYRALLSIREKIREQLGNEEGDDQ